MKIKHWFPEGLKDLPPGHYSAKFEDVIELPHKDGDSVLILEITDVKAMKDE